MLPSSTMPSHRRNLLKNRHALFIVRLFIVSIFAIAFAAYAGISFAAPAKKAEPTKKVASAKSTPIKAKAVPTKTAKSKAAPVKKAAPRANNAPAPKAAPAQKISPELSKSEFVFRDTGPGYTVSLPITWEALTDAALEKIVPAAAAGLVPAANMSTVIALSKGALKTRGTPENTAFFVVIPAPYEQTDLTQTDVEDIAKAPAAAAADIMQGMLTTAQSHPNSKILTKQQGKDSTLLCYSANMKPERETTVCVFMRPTKKHFYIMAGQFNGPADNAQLREIVSAINSTQFRKNTLLSIAP